MADNMKRRKLLENKVASVGIVAMLMALLGNILIPSETGYFQTGKVVINFDQLPKELRIIMQTKNYSWTGGTSVEKVVWQAEKRKTHVREKFTDIEKITAQLFLLNLTYPKNNYTDKPVRVVSYMLTAKNKFNVVLFYLEVRGIFIDAKSGSFVIPYAENRVTVLFRRAWEIHELDKDNSTGMIHAEGEFFNLRTQRTVTLQTYLFYNETGYSEAYKIDNMI